jgi:hypothetical protein
MKSFSDKNISILAYVYIILPFIIFIIGWLHWYIALPITIVVLVSAYFSIRLYIPDDSIKNQIGNNLKGAVFVALLLVIWLLFSGIGGYSFQNVDHQYRNAIFQDLVKLDWPVLYHIEGFPKDHPLEGKNTLLVYYLAYWMPASVVGKAFGIEIGRFFLFLWSFIGLSLVIYNLSKYFKRFSLKVFLLFISWGTLYFIGSFYTFPFKEVLKGNEYLWAGFMLFADGNTGLVYWTFNQTITPWLIMLLIMNQLQPKNILFFTSLIFFHGPFSFIGILPFIGLFIFEKEKFHLNNFNSILEKLNKYFTFQNIIGSATILGITYLYFSANTSGNVFNILNLDPKSYLVFMVLTIGIIATLIFDQYKKEPIYYLIILILLLLPFFQLGLGLDFTARVSIPAMFILMLLVGKYLINSRKGIRKTLIILYLIIAGLGHNLQFARSVYYTGLHHFSNSNIGEKVGASLVQSNNNNIKQIGKVLLFEKGRNGLLQNDLKTLKNPYNFQIKNYMGIANQSFFYKNLAKKNEGFDR